MEARVEKTSQTKKNIPPESVRSNFYQDSSAVNQPAASGLLRNKAIPTDLVLIVGHFRPMRNFSD